MDNSNPSPTIAQDTCPACDGDKEPRKPGDPPWPVCKRCWLKLPRNTRSGWVAARGKYEWWRGRYERNYQLTTQYLIETAKENQPCTTSKC